VNEGERKGAGKSGKPDRPKKAGRKANGRASGSGSKGGEAKLSSLKRAEGKVLRAITDGTRTKDHRRVLRGRIRTEPRGRGTAFEAYFAAEPLPPDQPTLVFQHLQKTAGTAMREIIYANLVNQRDAVEHVVLDVRKANDGPRPLRAWYEDWWGSLDRDRRDRLILATSHSANYLLEVISRPTRGFTVAREPLDRVLSRYYFRSNPPRYSLLDVYRMPRRFTRTRSQYFNYQSCALLEPRYEYKCDQLTRNNGPPPNAETWRKRLRQVLDDKYIVGVQDRFDEVVELFAREFGWTEVFVPKARINRGRPKELDERTRELLLAYNWLDVELYEECVRRMDRQLVATASARDPGAS
jgi:hypothetical protein